MLKQVKINGKLLENGLKQLNYEQQRTRRFLPQPKPLWKPVSIQKLFNVPQTYKILKEDEEQLKEEEAIYLDKFRSIKEYFYQEFTLPILQGGSKTELKETEEEHQRLLEENRQENERVAKLREERIKEERKVIDQIEFQRKLTENEKYLIEKEKAIELINREKERYSTYITKEKLNDAIESALDHPTSYEFAIDLNGILVFNKKLHPDALEPSAVPDSSDVVNGFIDESQTIQLKAKKLYYNDD